MVQETGLMRNTQNIPSKTNFLVGTAGLLASKLVQGWMSTLDYRIGFYDRSVDPALGLGGTRIYIFWHENILFPLYLRGNCRLAMLLSQHRDADILAHIAHHVGFDCVRGSTYRGGVDAVRELLKKSDEMHLTITPDGPRGPRRQLAQGPIYLASRLKLPLIALGFGYNRPWRTRSWDRFAIPKPYSRARGLVSPPIRIPPNLDRSGIETCRLRVEKLLNCLTVEAETWAESGHRLAGEVHVHPQAAPISSRSKRTAPDAGPEFWLPTASKDAKARVA
jgi:lysophospholipid acyltransferase (LPLAT)-like uncharacterized protein